MPVKREIEMKELILKLNIATKAYDAGSPVISDRMWDDMYFKLKRLEEETGKILPDSPHRRVCHQ